MKNKKILVLSIAIMLMAIVVGVAFARTGSLDGVIWANFDDSTMQVSNQNDYPVMVYIDIGGTDSRNRGKSIRLGAGEGTLHPNHVKIRDNTAYVYKVERVN